MTIGRNIADLTSCVVNTVYGVSDLALSTLCSVIAYSSYSKHGKIIDRMKGERT